MIDNKEALLMLTTLFSQHEEGEAFITDKVSYLMRNITKRARKNYVGAYDKPYDSVTGEEKYFPPLTESFTDGVIKSVDIDTKDIKLVSRNSSNIGATRLTRAVLINRLEEAEFGEAVNTMLRFLSIDGHAALKFDDYYDKKKKRRVMKITAVDMLNVVIDQSADNFADASGFLERSLLNNSELRSMEAWDKDAVDEVIRTAPKSFTRYALNVGGGRVNSGAPMYSIYDYWGQVELIWVTGKKGDKDKWVEGHIVASSLNDTTKAQILFMEVNKKDDRPYEDVPLKKVIGRLQGRGIPEQLFGTQKYLNGIINIRKKNAQILQNGLFKAKKGLGLTADTIISKITSGGIIQVEEMDDFQQLAVQDSRPSSYQDEDRLIQWGERNTGAFDIRRGEAMSASAPATNTLIQDRNSRDIFQLVQENVGLMLSRFIEKHVLPWVIENTSDGDIVKMTGSLKELEEMDEALVEHMVNKKAVEFVEKNRQYPAPADLLQARQKMRTKLRKMGNVRFVEAKKKLMSPDYGVHVTLTNELFDTGAIVERLQEMLTLAVANPGVLNLDPQGIADEMFSILDIPTDRLYLESRRFMSPLKKLEAAEEAKAKAEEEVRAQQAAQQAQPQTSQAQQAVAGKAAPQQNTKNLQQTAGGPQVTTQSSQNLTQLGV